MALRPTIAVVYKKKYGSKHWLKVFTDLPCPDKLLSTRTKLLPQNSEIVELGAGKGFIEKYKAKYKL